MLGELYDGLRKPSCLTNIFPLCLSVPLPYCERGTELQVTASVKILLSPTGTDIDARSTPVWNNASHVDCLNCGSEGTVEDLATVGIKKQPVSERVAERFRKEIN